MIALLLACNKAPETADTQAPPPPELELPDLEGIDMPTALQEAMARAVHMTMEAPWSGNQESLNLWRSGCPDFYIGAPPETDIDSTLSWMDRCQTAGGLFFDGYLGWSGDYSQSGDITTPEGLAIEATRQLEGDGAVGDNNGLFLSFDGHAEESISRIDAPGYSHWAWSSLVQGQVDGSYTLTDGVFSGGWRTDLYLNASGGDVEHLELRGNGFFPNDTIQDRFDSFNMDLALDRAGALPESCTLEPAGWIGLRDNDAFWYDLVFRPRYDSEDYTNEPYAACDGCGTLFLRGVEITQEIGTVCVDLSTAFDVLLPPDPTDFVVTLHDLEEGP